MMRRLGCNVTSDRSCPTPIFDDNLSVILHTQSLATVLSKKHIAISFHIVREAVVAGIIESYWLKGTFNTSDIMTKQIPRPNFKEHVDYIHWCPDFQIKGHNMLDDLHMNKHQ